MKLHYKTSAGGVSQPGWIVGDWVCVRTTRTAPGDGPDWKPVGVSDPVWAGLDATDGVDGKDGVDGRDGKDGRDGADGVGESFNPRGEWKRKADYKRLDVVYVPGEGAFVATIDSPTKSPTSSKSGWMQITADGADGEDGEAVVYAQRGRPGRDGRDAIAGIPAIFDDATPVGGVVRVSTDGHVSLALAFGSDAAALAVGFATAGVAAGKAGNYVNSGLVSNDAWHWNPGAPLYLSLTDPGELTETYPTTIGGYVVICGVAVSATEVAVGIQFQNYIGA